MKKSKNLSQKLHYFWDKWNQEKYEELIEENSEKNKHLIFIKNLKGIFYGIIFPKEKEKKLWKINRTDGGKLRVIKRKNISIINIDSFIPNISVEEFEKMMRSQFLARNKSSLGDWSFAILCQKRPDIFKLCPNLINKKNKFAKETYNFLRNSIVGGWVKSFRVCRGEIGHAIDQNSSYGSAMVREKMPVGLPLEDITGHLSIKQALSEGKMGFVKLRVLNLRYVGKHYPWLAKKNKDFEERTDYPEKYGDGYLIPMHTSLLKRLLKDYKGTIEYVRFMVFEHIPGKEIFGELVEQCQNWKNNNPKGSWQNIVGKMIPNILYGRLGMDFVNQAYEWAESSQKPKGVSSFKDGDKYIWLEKVKKINKNELNSLTMVVMMILISFWMIKKIDVQFTLVKLGSD